MSIERRFDVPLIACMALREKQIQQHYRPIIGVHKWFARRPGTLFRGLILAEFSKDPLERAFFQSNDLAGLRIVDPFMGGGTPLIEANRVGCDVEGFDVNPMSAWIVREEMEQPARQKAHEPLALPHVRPAAGDMFHVPGVDGDGRFLRCDSAVRDDGQREPTQHCGVLSRSMPGSGYHKNVTTFALEAVPTVVEGS